MKRILLIMADEAERAGQGSLLAAAGFRVLEATGGRAGFRQAAMLKPHAIVVDDPPCDMSLAELMDKLKAAERTADIPVVAISGDGPSGDSRVSRFVAQDLAAEAWARVLAEVTKPATEAG